MVRRLGQSVRSAPWIGVIVLLLAVATSTQSYLYQRCQSDRNDEFARVIKVRAQWAKEDQDALRQLIRTAVQQPVDRDRNFRATINWLSTVEKNDTLRSQNPLPDIEKGCRWWTGNK